MRRVSVPAWAGEVLQDYRDQEMRIPYPEVASLGECDWHCD